MHGRDVVRRESADEGGPACHVETDWGQKGQGFEQVSACGILAARRGWRAARNMSDGLTAVQLTFCIHGGEGNSRRQTVGGGRRATVDATGDRPCHWASREAGPARRAIRIDVASRRCQSRSPEPGAPYLAERFKSGGRGVRPWTPRAQRQSPGGHRRVSRGSDVTGSIQGVLMAVAPSVASYRIASHRTRCLGLELACLGCLRGACVWGAGLGCLERGLRLGARSWPWPASGAGVSRFAVWGEVAPR